MVYPSNIKWGAKYCSMKCKDLDQVGKSSWNKGKKMSEEQRKQLSISVMGRPSAFKGRHHSEESKNQMSEKRKDKKWTLKQKENHTLVTGSKSHFWLGGLMRDAHYQSQRKIKNANDRRVRKLGAKGSHTIKEWEELKRKFKYKCASCGLKKPLTEDHIIPLSRGGTDYIENIQPLCRSCNAIKYTKVIKFSYKIPRQTEFIL